MVASATVHTINVAPAQDMSGGLHLSAVSHAETKYKFVTGTNERRRLEA